MAAKTARRRSYGTGALFERADSAGRVTWYGKWRSDGVQLKRRIGPKRAEGSRDGLTKRQAEAELRRLIATVDPARVVHVPGDALTIAELGRRYLADVEAPSRKRATVVAIESAVRTWLEPYFGERDLRKITEQDVRELMGMMRDGRRPGPRRKGDRRYGKPCSVKTLHNYIGTLSALLSYGEREGWLAVNVARRIKLPAAVRSEDIRFLEPDDVDALVAAAIAGPFQAIDRALYLTAAMTGLRQGELCALRWRDVDWGAGRVRVRQNYVLGEFGTPKSRRSSRSVPLADVVAGELDRLSKAAPMADDDALVFADPHTGGPLGKPAILRRYRQALKAAALDESHRFHDLRHTFGTRMAATGVPMRTLQEWMGHRDRQTTERYADYAPSEHEAAFVEAAFGRGTNRGTNMSESESSSDDLSSMNPGMAG